MTDPKLGPTENSTRVIDGIQAHWLFIVLFAKVAPVTRKKNCAWPRDISAIPSEKIVIFNLTGVKGQHKLNHKQRRDSHWNLTVKRGEAKKGAATSSLVLGFSSLK